MASSLCRRLARRLRPCDSALAQPAHAELERRPMGRNADANLHRGLRGLCARSIGEPHKVGAFAPWDLQGTYSGFRGLQLVAGIRNLFDSDPPVSNQPFFFQSGYNPQIASPLGRLFYLRATYSWR